MISSINIKNLKKRLISLTKEIYLKKPPDNNSPLKYSFCAGNKPILPGGWLLDGWITKKGIIYCREIAEMIVRDDSQFYFVDLDSVHKIINSVIQENVLNNDIFNSDKVIFQAETLFEARSTDNVQDFISRLWEKILMELNNSVNHWLITYPLHKVISPSFDLGFDEIQILNSDDFKIWQELAQNFPGLTSLNPVNGSVEGSVGFSPSLGKIPCWVACSVSGTEVGARKKAELLISKFLAILFSYLEDKQTRNCSTSLLMKSMASPWRDSIQFSKSPTSNSIVRSSIGTLLPPLLTEANVLPEDISNLQDFYSQRNSCLESKMRKMITASHFIHYAIIHDDLERFLHFFFALDAMFGERFKVEKNIIEGIEKVFPGDETWKERTEWLFDLRSELVHGGSSQISEWKKFDEYRSHFKSHPLDDIKVAAMTALKSYLRLSAV